MTPEEAQKVSDLRARILANVSKGLPPHTGLEAAELKAAIEFIRKDNTAAQSKSKASGVTNLGGAPPIPVDLATLFTSAPSKK